MEKKTKENNEVHFSKQTTLKDAIRKKNDIKSC